MLSSNILTYALLLACIGLAVGQSCTEPNCASCPNDVCQQCQDTFYITG